MGIRLIQVILISALIIACKSNKTEFVITGKFEAASGKKVELRKDKENKKVVIDSAYVSDNGEFRLSGNTLSAGIYSLVAHNGEYIYLIIHPKDHIHIDITGIGPIPDYYIEGSYDSRLIKKLTVRKNKVYSQIDKLSSQYEKHKADTGDFTEEKIQIDKKYDKLIKDHKTYSISFIKENSQSLVCLMVLEQQFSVYDKPFFDRFEDIGVFNFVDSCLTRKYPDSEEVRRFNEFVALSNDIIKNREYQKTVMREGMPAPDISLPDTKGDTLRLSDFKGNFVLITFWASWNTYSVHKVKETQKFAENHENFIPFYVSLDKDLRHWKMMSDSLGIIDNNVSDLKYWDSETVNKYNVKVIPGNCLIDQNGLVAGINLDNNQIDNLITR